MSFCRFALYDYAGNPKRYFIVDREEISEDETSVAPEVTHLVLIVDRSGSMYRDMAAMRSMVEKLLTLEEYRDASMLATLISYSSQGDYTVHFSRRTVADIMKPGSAEVEAIRQLRVTGLTCISQALEASKAYIEDGETTCIALHSDGYANDRSPTSERRQIEAICNDMASLPGVFVNTIAYSAYSDFKLLLGIANAMSGKCIQAGTVKEVYDALHDTTSLLAGRMSPAIQASIGGGTYQAFVSRSAGRINGGGTDMLLRGLKPEDDKTLYRFFEVDADTYDSHSAPVCSDTTTLEPVYAFCAAKLSEGQLNTSKFALMATRMSDLVRVHYRALTAPALAAMYEDLKTAIFRPTIRWGDVLPSYGLGLHKIPLLTLLQYLSKHARSLEVDMEHLTAHYTRRGLKKIRGKRLEDGQILEPRVDSRVVGTKSYAQVHRFELNNNTASINMLVARPIELVKDGEAVSEVAGVRLEGDNQLYSYNNYTIVGDGELNVSSLRLSIRDKKVFRQLKKWDLVEDLFDPVEFYTIDLSDLPLVDFLAPFNADVLEGVFFKLAQAKIIVSMMNALLTKKSDRFTDAQLEELDQYHLTSSLNFSPPMTVPYTKKEDAFAVGLIDTRVSYQIDIGTTQILSRGKLPSANAVVQRFFVAHVNGQPLPKGQKPKLTLWWDENTTWDLKKLTARTKITVIDELTLPIFKEFLGFGTQQWGIGDALARLEVEEEDIQEFFAAIRRELDPDDVVELFTRVQTQVSRFSSEIFSSRVRPLVFYMGATGLLPDELDTQALTADAMKERYPTLKIGKPEQEGTFFVLNNNVISVYEKQIVFSVD